MGYSSGTYKVSFSAPIVAVIPLLSGCMYGVAHSHSSPCPVPAGLQVGSGMIAIG